MANFLVVSLLHLSYPSFPCFLFVFSSPLHIPNSTMVSDEDLLEELDDDGNNEKNESADPPHK